MCWLKSIRRPPSSARTYRGGLALFLQESRAIPRGPDRLVSAAAQREMPIAIGSRRGTARRGSLSRRPTAPGLGQTAAASWPTIKKTRGDNKGRAAAAVCYYYVCPCMQFFIPNI
jgi:hypothetical protein